MSLVLKLKTVGKNKTRAFFETTKDIMVNGVLIPKGTPTDGTSIPRVTIPIGLVVTGIGGWLHSIPLLILGFIIGIQVYLFPDWARYWKEILLHDYFFLLEEYEKGNSEFKRAMKENGRSKLKIYWFMTWLYVFRKWKEFND